MANRRMMTKKITNSDAFTEMPLSAQALYLHLNMEADDDGFVNSPKRIQRMIGASEDDLKLLVAKRFVLVFESGIIVIKHWRMHNYIQKDRYTPTQYQEELAQLAVKDDGSYTELTNVEISTIPEDVSILDTECIQDGYILYTQVRDRDRDRERERDSKEKKKETKHKHGMYKNVLLSDSDLEKLKNEFPGDWEFRIERLSEYMESTGKKYKNHLATIRVWARKESGTKTAEAKHENTFAQLSDI